VGIFPNLNLKFMNQSAPPTPAKRELPAPSRSTRAMAIMLALAALITAIIFMIEPYGFLAPLDLRAYDLLTAIKYFRIVPPTQPYEGPVFNVDFD
jgi:CHASE2 domain-containing sensor protein